jgi:putative transposase
MESTISIGKGATWLATKTALPVASPTGNGGAASGMVPVVVGKVTPVRYELAVGRSGQEENRAHFCALSR